MFKYVITFSGGSQIEIRANSPKEAWNNASKAFKDMEVIRVNWKK